MNHLIKYASFSLLALIIILGVAGISGKNSPEQAQAQSASNKLSGYAWSDTIGWVSFSDSKSTATMATDGTLSGYAWSENVGWLSFDANDIANCPSGTCTPKVNMTTGAVSGWARAIAGCQDNLWDPVAKKCTGAGAGDTNGIYSGVGTPPINVTWDGWVDLSGVTYNTSKGTFSGYGWGADVVGWLSFNVTASASTTTDCDPTLQVCANSNAPTCSLYAAAGTVPLNTTANLHWSSTNATSCTLRDASGTTLSSATSSVGFVTSPITAQTTFNLYCSNASVATPALCSNTTIGITGTTTSNSGSSGLWLKNNPLVTNITARPNSAVPVNWDVSSQMGDGYACTEKTNTPAGTWVNGTAIPAQTSPNGSPVVTLRNLTTGIYTISIDCTKGALASSTNSATINIIPSSINEN